MNVKKEQGELDIDIVDKYDRFPAEFVMPKEEIVAPFDDGRNKFNVQKWDEQ